MTAQLSSYCADGRMPWLDLMAPSHWRIPDHPPHGLDLFEDALARNPDGPAVAYFDRVLTYREVDAESRAFAAALVAGGFKPGDRLSVYMQNIPAFAIAMLAAWKAGGALVPINPMNKARELAVVLNDARPHTLVLEPDLIGQAYDLLETDVYRPKLVVVASPWDYQSRDDRRVLPERRPVEGFDAFLELIEQHRDVSPPSVERDPADCAFLVYTSGTTGVPKAAIISHKAAARASTYAEKVYDLKPHEPIMALAPVFHTTGLMCTMVSALRLASPIIFTYRFQPEVSVEAIREYRPTYTAAAPTAYIALTQAEGARIEDFASFKACAIGGAAVSPALVARLKAEFGVPAQSGFGMTEVGGAVSVVPFEWRDKTPVDAESGAISIGIPFPGVHMWIADDTGSPVGPGHLGEIIVDAPTNMTGYWDRPDATAETLRTDGLRTGDIGFMDTDGWFYLVDRKKDMIVAGGYKVWPREVEDVLYGHPAVLEAAVVGVAHDYRGETVKAYIRVRPGREVTVSELQAYCRETLAAYKRPAEFAIVEDLPKTASGKIMRAALRQG